MDDDGVAEAQVEALDLVHVVERRVGDGHTPNEHGLELGHRRDGAGASHLELHVVQRGARLLRWILVGDGPAWLPGHLAELVAQGELVHLHHGAVDLVAERVALCFEVADVVAAGGEVIAGLRPGVDVEPPGAERIEGLGVAPGLPAGRGDTDAVAEHRQRPRGGDVGIELAQAAGGAIAGIDDGPLAGGEGAFVEGAEALDGHVDFAPHLKLGRGVVRQPRGNRADGADVGGDVLAGFAVAARGAAHQDAVLVQKAHRHAVDLRLAGIGGLVVIVKQAAAAFGPAGEFLLVAALVE